MLSNSLRSHAEPRLLIELYTLVKFLKEEIAFIPKLLDDWVTAFFLMFLRFSLFFLRRLTGIYVQTLHFAEYFALLVANHYQLALSESVYRIKASFRFGLLTKVLLVFFLHVGIL
jgi:hypothetical protein